MTTIGIDFDNTIVCYDGAFHKAALERDLIPADGPRDKIGIRDYLRERDGEDDWIALQGYVYGPGMKYAHPFPGALECLSALGDTRTSLLVISHRTAFPFLGPQYDLHDAARQWLQEHGFSERSGLARDNMFFETTKEMKLQRITDCGCSVFIDDLPEFLCLEGFPPGVLRIWFDPGRRQDAVRGLEHVCSWEEIHDRLSPIVGTGNDE